MPIIVNVIPWEDYKLLIELGNGHAIILDMESKLSTLRFAMLANKDIFKKVYTDGSSVIWRKGVIRMSMAEIIRMLQDVYPMSIVA